MRSEWAVHGLCMGRAPAMHRTFTGRALGVQGDEGDFGDQVCSGCHVLVTSFVLGGEFW